VSGRTIVVTGASSGIGEATARLLARAGDTVVMACRRLDRGEAAAARIRAAEPSLRGALIPMACDLASLRSVRAFAGDVLSRVPRIDALVNNAGVVPRKRELTEDGFEHVLAVSFLGPFLLTSLLLPALRSGPRAGRIVNLAGIYHRHGVLEFDDLMFERRAWTLGAVNAQAQLARVALTVELARRVPARECTSNAVHPGAVKTHAQDHAPLWAKLLMSTVARPVFVGPEEGAEPVVHLVGASELEGISGRFFDRMHESALVPQAVDPETGERLWQRATELTGSPSP
jgi:NAD(P)-dependent dehydrogenase (short-subunit alcohol dehydrogenase family)